MKAAADAKTKESGAVWDHTGGDHHNGTRGQHAVDYNANNISRGNMLPGDMKESDFANSASDISDNTHIGEHWDGPKRGRIIREYRRAMD